MPQMNMIQALNSAMDICMERDRGVTVMGEDVGYFGGVFNVTDGLQRKYGTHRAFDTPIAEGGIVAAAIGMAINGLRPVAEIQFADYIYPAFDQIVSELARLRYRTAGKFYAPMTIRAPCGGGIRGGQTHSQSPEAIFAHVCGLKILMPSNPYDAKGLLISAIEDDDPVVFFEPKRLYNGPFDGDPNKPAEPWSHHPKGEVPEGHYTVPIGEAEIVRAGNAVTVVTYGTMVHVAQATADMMGVDAEIIDVRSIVPLDVEALTRSVEKTGRCVVMHEATRYCGFGAELLATIQEECFWHLEAPIQRVAGWDTPYPHAFEWEYFPGQKRAAAALEAVLGTYMGEYTFKLPDLGEGTVEAEIGEWHVKPGDTVNEDDVLVDMMTDKAAVEIPSPVSGRIVSTQGEAGDMIPVGSALVVFETDGEATAAPAAREKNSAEAESAGTSAAAAPTDGAQASADSATVAGGGTALTTTAAQPTAGGRRTITSPAIRRRAREAGIDLRQVAASGPRGRILQRDLEAYIARRTTPRAPQPDNASTATREIRIIGLRRVIARRMSEAKRNIPHYSYVEEVDVTALETLRGQLKAANPQASVNLTYLPFLIMALGRVLKDYPQCNALYDREREVLVQHAAMHIGVATQTPDGLKVPVVRHANALNLWELVREVQRVTGAARDGTARRHELSGSTITITSLGKLGGIVSTPVINAPEVGIIGVNKAVERAVVVDGKIEIRRMMNLSSSFDHRFVDGYDAASMIQAIKLLLEHPAALFVPPAD